MMPPAFARRTGVSSMPMDSVFARQQLMDVPSMDEAVAEYQLARLVFQARVRALARMNNFFLEQRQHQPSPTIMARQQMPPITALPRNVMSCAVPMPQMAPISRRVSSSSDDCSKSIERQFLTDTSESSQSLGSCSAKSLQLKVYIDTIRDTDVLCGRGGRSNHHIGNKRYRSVIAEMKLAYKSTEAKANKTDLSRQIVDHVISYGGRFIKKEASSGRYFVLTRGEARKKTSQALRESKDLKWTK